MGIELEISLDGVRNGNVLFLKGKHDRASPIFVSGKLRITNPKNISFRKINIRLLGKIRLNIPIPVKKTENNDQLEFIKLESYFYQHCWNKIETTALKQSTENVKGGENSKNAHFQGTKYIKNLISNINVQFVHTKRNILTFAPGEHIFSFSAILPGDLPESVHNHPNVFVSYQLSATIQQCNGLSDLTATRQIIFIRTISIDMLDFQNSEFAEKKSKHKISIQVELPWKFAAIGSQLDIPCTIKSKNDNTKVKKVIIKLIEYSRYQHKNKSVNKRKKINELTVSDPYFFSKNMTNSKKPSVHLFKCFSFPIPNNLSQLTQDCSILENIKVLHEIELEIQVLLPNGESCLFELQLPVFLYISSFIPVETVQRNYFKEPSLQFSSPPIETDKPLLCNSRILTDQNFRVYENKDISNCHVLMKDLFPTSYEDHIYDAKVEIYDHINFAHVNYINNNSIVKCDSLNINRLKSVYDVKYPPPQYEPLEKQIRNKKGLVIDDNSIDLVDMRIDCMNKL